MTTAKKRLRKTLAPLLFATAASAGLSLGACAEEEENNDAEDPGTIEVSEDIVDACVAYCGKLAECNEETVESECEEKCKGVLYACEEHEPGEAIDQVNQCAEKDCLAFPLCTASAGVQCLTGLGF